jgi:hypothetical protein
MASGPENSLGNITAANGPTQKQKDITIITTIEPILGDTSN